MILTRNQDGSCGEALIERTRKIHNVSWGQLTKTKEVRGFGFRTMRETNAAFPTKLGWRLLTEKDKLWSLVLQAK